MKYYTVLPDGKWKIVACLDEKVGKTKILFKSLIEDDCYDYLEKYAEPTTRSCKRDLEYLLDQHRLSKYIPEPKRRAISYYTRSRAVRGAILVSLKEGWVWEDKDEILRFIDPEHTTVCAPSTSELYEISKYIVKI